MGKIIFVKNVGKNLKSFVVHYRDGYYVYAARRDKPNSDTWRESQATAYPRSKDEAIADARGVNKSMLLALHPALRDEGTSRAPSYSYKIQRKKMKRVS